jgi:hypothetical protein
LLTAWGVICDGCRGLDGDAGTIACDVDSNNLPLLRDNCPAQVRNEQAPTRTGVDGAAEH